MSAWCSTRPRVSTPNSISVSWAIFVGLVLMSNRQEDTHTDRPHYMSSNWLRLMLCIAMRPNNSSSSSRIIEVSFYYQHFLLPSVLWCCWLDSRKGIRPVKTEWWGAGMVMCLERGADLHMAQLMPLPLTVSCFSKIHIGFTFLVRAHLGSPGNVCACVCIPAVFILSC